ncbi:MAG: domain protein beta Propeller [Bryobacterales bacterium]|nr:domain protein beta Propeller [Bryobacterales bacterium]
MKTRHIAVFSALAAVLVGAIVLGAQDARIEIIKGDRPVIAVADMHGSGAAQQYMDQFNKTLWDELDNTGQLRLAPKTSYPLEVPQQPSDFKPPALFSIWTRPPVGANYLAFGYTAVQDNQILLYGFFFNLGQPSVQSAQVFGNRYYGALSNDGAKKVAREFAADILRQLGIATLSGTKIYFASDRTGGSPIKEIWSMDYDGSNQKQLTRYGSSTSQPAVSADGKLFAFMTYAGGNPQIRIHTADTSRRQTFVNPVSSAVATPEFTPDGKNILFAATVDGWLQLMMAGIDGGGMRRISNVRAIEVSPRVNPKTGSDLLFISGRSGHQQLWRMNLDGTDREMLTTGEGDVANPSWSPDGHHIAFCWTRGYEPGNFNIFVMDIADRKYVQLTSNSGRNENPWWAPDGVHLVFSSMRGRVTQLYTMLADGTNVKQLTTQGNNIQPVWAKGIE